MRMLAAAIAKNAQPEPPAPLSPREPHRRLSEGSFYVQAHRSPVTALAFIPEMRLLCSASLDGAVKVFDVDRLSERLALCGHLQGVRCLCWSPRHKVLVTGGLDHRVIVWSTLSHAPLAILLGPPAPVVSVAVDDTAGVVFALAGDGVAYLWDLHTSNLLQTIKAVDPLTHARYQHCFYDTTQSVRLLTSTRLVGWRYTKAAQEPSTHDRAPVRLLLFNSAFGALVAVDESSSVCVWDTRTCACIARFSTHHRDTVTSACFDSPSQRRLFTAAADGVVKVWNFHWGILLRQYSVAVEDAHAGERLEQASQGMNEHSVLGLG